MPAKKWYTVVGICDEQRHAYHVRASSVEAAESQACRQHSEHGDLFVAGVLTGKLVLVDEDDAGLTLQRAGEARMRQRAVGTLES